MELTTKLTGSTHLFLDKGQMVLSKTVNGTEVGIIGIASDGILRLLVRPNTQRQYTAEAYANQIVQPKDVPEEHKAFIESIVFAIPAAPVVEAP